MNLYRSAACITTRNRPEQLESCLRALSQCDPTPDLVVVSDDSPTEEAREANQAVVSQFAGVEYCVGPRRGVCANRNNAVRHAFNRGIQLVSFVDDDIHLAPSFFKTAYACYARAGTSGDKLIVTGARPDENGAPQRPVRLSFRIYFEASQTPECVDIHAAVFPIVMFETEPWDEDIFFGLEDGELCIRALRAGYRIEVEPALLSKDTLAHQSTLSDERSAAGLPRYQVYVEAARLYIGVKRYAFLEGNPLKLAGFLGLYFTRLPLYLLRRGRLGAFPTIVRTANLGQLMRTRRLEIKRAASIKMGIDGS